MCINRCHDVILFHASLVFFNDGPRIPEEIENPGSDQVEFGGRQNK